LRNITVTLSEKGMPYSVFDRFPLAEAMQFK